MYYENDKDTPYFKQNHHIPFSSKEIVDVLLCEKPIACSRVPLQVMENASFIIDLDKLVNPKDITSDDLGKWIHIGSPKSYVDRDCHGEFVVRRKPNFEAEFILSVQHFRHHDEHSLYKKRISTLSDGN